MINKVTLLGRLGAGVEVRRTNSGDKVGNLRIATTEVWQKDGEWNERVEWHQVSAFGDGLVGVLEKHGRKGALVYLEGKLRTRSWEKDGETRYSTEIVLDRDGVVRFPERKSSNDKQEAAE